MTRFFVFVFLLLAHTARAALTVTTGVGATNVTATSAWLTGAVTATNGLTNAVMARIYYGQSNGGTNTNSWASVVFFPVSFTNGAVFSTNITGLVSSRLYYYRVYATESNVAAWSATATNFTTLAGAPTATVVVASSLSVMTGTNGAVVAPTNFWSANAATIAAIVGTVTPINSNAVNAIVSATNNATRAEIASASGTVYAAAVSITAALSNTLVNSTNLIALTALRTNGASAGFVPVYRGTTVVWEAQSAGQINTNIGGGVGLFQANAGGTNQFRTLRAGSGIEVTGDASNINVAVANTVLQNNDAGRTLYQPNLVNVTLTGDATVSSGGAGLAVYNPADGTRAWLSVPAGQGQAVLSNSAGIAWFRVTTNLVVDGSLTVRGLPVSGTFASNAAWAATAQAASNALGLTTALSNAFLSVTNRLPVMVVGTNGAVNFYAHPTNLTTVLKPFDVAYVAPGTYNIGSNALDAIAGIVVLTNNVTLIGAGGLSRRTVFVTEGGNNVHMIYGYGNNHVAGLALINSNACGFVFPLSFGSGGWVIDDLYIRGETDVLGLPTGNTDFHTGTVFNSYMEAQWDFQNGFPVDGRIDFYNTRFYAERIWTNACTGAPGPGVQMVRSGTRSRQRFFNCDFESTMNTNAFAVVLTGVTSSLSTTEFYNCRVSIPTNALVVKRGVSGIPVKMFDSIFPTNQMSHTTSCFVWSDADPTLMSVNASTGTVTRPVSTTTGTFTTSLTTPTVALAPSNNVLMTDSSGTNLLWVVGTVTQKVNLVAWP